MGLTSSRLFEISLSDIFEKVRCYSTCCGGQLIVEDHSESNDKEHQEYSDFDIID